MPPSSGFPTFDAVPKGYWLLPLARRVARPGPIDGLEAEGSAPAGAGGFEKLPAWRRASSSWFNWFAVVPVICDGGCSLIPLWCVEARACRCSGGIADVVPPGAIPGAIAPGAVAAGARVGKSVAGYCVPNDGGRLEDGEEGPGPPGTG